MAQQNNVVPLTQVSSRLPMPQSATERGISPAQWRVLVETTFPSAQSPESIEMAFDYCKVRGLDVFKKPVHIVPMWNSALRKQVETIWPGINEVQITAARTGQWAGMDPANWGPMVKKKFKGERNRSPVEVEVEFPEWCEVVVYRIVAGQRCPFSEQVFWEEAYSTSGGRGSTLPTDMWIKRPRGQLHKVAKAASLRAAFPEEGELTAEEMEGKVIDAGGVVIEHSPVKPEQPKIDAPVEHQPAHEAEEHHEQQEPTAIYEVAPPPTAIPAPETDDGWLAWTKEALEQVKAAGNLRSAGLSMHDSAWVGKWLALNAENVVKVRKINPKWGASIDSLHKRVTDFMKEQDEAVKTEAAERFPTYQHSDSDQPDWIDFEATMQRYIRDTPNPLIARDWWNRHKASVEFGLAKAGKINNKEGTGEQAARELKADLFKAFPQLAE